MNSDAPLFEKLAAALRERRPVALATVVGTEGSVPRHVGARMVVYGDGSIDGSIGGGKLEDLVVQDARGLLARREAATSLHAYPLHEASPESFGAICGGTVTVFVEAMQCGPRLISVGAGHCSRALARAAMLLGWQVEAIEDRAEDLSEANFPGARRVVAEGELARHMASHPLDAQTAVVLLNRNYMLDRDCLRELMKRRRAEPGSFPFYVGMIGSDRKVRRVREELGAEGFGEADFAGLHAPVGLAIGADTPQEIAVAVLAEIIGELAGAGRTTAKAR